MRKDDYETMRKSGYSGVNMFWARSVKKNRVAFLTPEHPENLTMHPNELYPHHRIERRGGFFDNVPAVKVGYCNSLEELAEVGVKLHSLFMGEKS